MLVLKGNSSLAQLSLAFLGGLAAGSLILSTKVGFAKKGKPKAKDITVADAEAHLWKIVQYSFSGCLLHAGDKLGIYELLHKYGPISAQDLAKQQSWSARWVQEFLLQACAAGICEYDSSTNVFSLHPSYAPFLRPPTVERKSLAGMFQFLLPLLNRSQAVVESIQTGQGVNYDFGDDVNSAIDRKNRNWFTYQLVDDLLSQIKMPQTGRPLVTVLEEGVNVADIGCGCGASSIALAKRFPKSHVYAYESSQNAMRVMRERIAAESLQNITVCDVATRDVSHGPSDDSESSEFGFVYAHDVLHDMTHPRALIRDVREKLSKKEGVWVIVDVDCSESLEENLKKPNAATLYGFSCLLCLASSSSHGEGEALGTCGFPSTLARRYLTQGGFTHFEKKTFPMTLADSACFIVA